MPFGEKRSKGLAVYNDQDREFLAEFLESAMATAIYLMMLVAGYWMK